MLDFYEHLKFHAQVSWAWNKLFNLEARPRGYKTWVQSQTQKIAMIGCLQTRVRKQPIITLYDGAGLLSSVG